MTNSQGNPNGRRSFAVPHTAIQALLKARADAVTIGAYLKLAAHTEATGQFSSAGVSAIQDAVGGGKDRFNRGRAQGAIAKLCAIRAAVQVSEETPSATPAPNFSIVKGKKKQPSAFGIPNSKPTVPTQPLVYTREAWLEEQGGEVPDGPTDRSRIRYVLPTFGEPIDKRAWFGSSLVFGDGEDGILSNPLQQLKHCGDVAARLLLAMYAGQDIDRWYGISPHGLPWHYYTLEETHHGQVRVIRGQRRSPIIQHALFSSLVNSEVATGSKKDGESLWSVVFAALQALESAGFIYEMSVLLNRNPIPAKFSNGESYGNIPEDAEILCDLGSPNLFGPAQPEIEQGLGADYVATVKALEWDEKPYDYLAIVPTGYPVMIVGLYRLRFRVTNYGNAFIETAERKLLDANAAALRMLNHLRRTKNLERLTRTLQSSSIPLLILFNVFQ